MQRRHGVVGGYRLPHVDHSRGIETPAHGWRERPDGAGGRHRRPSPWRRRARKIARGVGMEPGGVLMSEQRPTGADRSLPEPADQVRAELHAALAELAEAGTRVYHDPVADRADAERYYGGVDLDHLARLVDDAHRDRPRYQPARELYPWIDLQPDRMLRSLYTGLSYDPAGLIAEDFRIGELRRVERTRLTAAGPGLEAAAVEDTVERMLPYNCEHVVPQSWFGKTEPMRGDLHHLFAFESRCNSFRGNTPYREFADFPDLDEVVRSDCGKTESNGFEPAHGKGAAVRAVFYFVLRYPDTISVDELPADHLDILLDWHEQEAVSEWERHRNAAIFARQGNRNPFIDHPEWAAQVVPRLRVRMS
jgi:endonuclease G